MAFQKYKPVLWILVASIIVFAFHKIFFLFFDAKAQSHFYYQLSFLYSLFCVFSMVIVLILIFIRQKNIDSVGQAFLLLTCVKMAGAYAVLYPILQLNGPEAKIEKINFFIVFALFLTIETLVTIRILNNKQ